MPRLKPGEGPISRDEGWWQTREEHDAWVREVYAKHHPTETPRPCDCGYHADEWLVLCGDRERDDCRRHCAKRLATHHRRKHEAALSEKRKFPSLGRTSACHCAWCKQPIVHGRVKQRGMHDGRLDEPNCRRLHDLHTNLDVQRGYLLKRDGLGCKACGAREGGWAHGRAENPERHRAWGAAWARRYPADVWVGEFSPVNWSTSLEVDHHIALAVAWEAFSEDARRRWFFSPANLRLLCAGCHKAKTADDRALLRDCYDQGPAWSKEEVLHRMADAGLIASPEPKGRT